MIKINAENTAMRLTHNDEEIQFVNSATDSPRAPIATSPIAIYPANSHRSYSDINDEISKFIDRQVAYNNTIAVALVVIMAIPAVIGAMFLLQRLVWRFVSRASRRW
jgi:hypothetical protein